MHRIYNKDLIKERQILHKMIKAVLINGMKLYETISHVLFNWVNMYKTRIWNGCKK